MYCPPYHRYPHNRPIVTVNTFEEYRKIREWEDARQFQGFVGIALIIVSIALICKVVGKCR